MEFYGTIVAQSGNPPLEKDRWIEMCASDPRLVRGAPKTRPNPFKPGEMMTVRPRADAVAIVVEDKKLGDMSWAEDDSPQINVWAADPAIVAIAHELASQLNAIFIED